MVAVYRFLDTYEGLIYLVLLLGGVFAIRWLIKAWREWREAVYRLEREFAQRRLGQSISILLVVLALMVGEFVLASFVIPSMPASVFLVTPTVDLLATPTGTILPATATVLALTPRLAAGAQAGDGCVPGQLEFTSPLPGQEVSGRVELTGTVNIPDFGFYKYEVAPRNSDTWATIQAGRETKVDESLGFWDVSVLTPGDYSLRLVVTDNAGESYPPCVIPVQVVGQ
jgi:hypothetical protein